jgi:hypothetical protein
VTAKIPYKPPAYQQADFNCPWCRAYAHQLWSDIITQYGGAPPSFANDFRVSTCMRCKLHGIWYEKQMVFPDITPVEPPNADLTDEIKADYEEAARIVNRSPRGAAALLRLCVQNLCIALGEDGKKIDDDIKALVRKGLSPTIQKALDSLRVIGNNAVHPGQIALKDDPAIAAKLFKFLNLIAQTMISDPKEIDDTYNSLPTTALDSIKKRDDSAKPPSP